MFTKKGFTLVELITVIAILGVLMTLAGTAVFSILNQSRQDLLEEQIKGLQDTAITYVISTKVYLETCPSNFDPKNPTDSDCFMYVSVKDLIDSGFFDNKSDLCDETKQVIVYKSASGEYSELKSYVPEDICSY